ncbi:dehydrogenase with different specificitie [Colletotrichum acutatum]|uniref:Dehydrogenase with different specificitie n=1 Tax=Glomerella acutata TaxID=27357 RepID=A0AAD8UPK7_GLOAC|nr:dehydrogenase with different specificitie [Colletotrichum acutatum]KAK1724854.1 dehydrogenase with different specificitie [Colletotrichum acutatum]
MSSSVREAKPSVGDPKMSVNELFRLDERTILITGGGGSMGLEVARSVLESGGDVICIDRQESPLEEPWSKLTQRLLDHSHGTQAWYYRCDITDAENVKFVFAESMKKTRFPFRGLVACAGISGDAPSIDFPINTARSIMDINVIGTLICAQAAAQEIQRQGSAGSIVLITSMSAHGSNKGVDTVAYNSSKSAVVQMARSLAAEWGSRADIPLIRVNSISPGSIRTRMTEEPLSNPDIEREWTNGNMLMRLSEAHEYRGPITFLLSDSSSFMTGSDVRVDGGHTAW